MTKMNQKILNKINFFFLILGVIYVFDGFTNSYIVLNKNYETRFEKNHGFCEKHSFGFVKKVIKKFSLSNLQLNIINYSDYPEPTGYFYNPYNKKDKIHLILLNPKSSQIISDFLNKGYSELYKEQNCYLLKKND